MKKGWKSSKIWIQRGRAGAEPALRHHTMTKGRKPKLKEDKPGKDSPGMGQRIICPRPEENGMCPNVEFSSDCITQKKHQQCERMENQDHRSGAKRG